MTKLRKHFHANEIVIDQPKWCGYMKSYTYCPLLQAFLVSKVPVGIILDFLEESMENFFYLGKGHDTHTTKAQLIQELRETYSDPTLLFDKSNPLFTI